MAFDFPSSPSDGQVYTPAGGPTYTYNTAGTKWLVTGTGLSGVATASTTEVLTGTSSSVAVTPDAAAALWEKGTNVASAATVSLGEGGFFHVTGTTTITDIDFAIPKDGRRAWVMFDGALTLTHGAATIQLPGGANILTAAGDRALFVQDSGDTVTCLSYQRNLLAPPSGGGSFTLSGSTPALGLTDTDTGAVNYITADNATGSLSIAANSANTVPTSSIAFLVDTTLCGNWNTAGLAVTGNLSATGLITSTGGTGFTTTGSTVNSFTRNGAGAAGAYALQVARSDTPAAGLMLVQFANNTIEIGKIEEGVSGTSTAYVTTSDMRMKEVESRRPIDDSGEVIDALEPVYYKWPGSEIEDFGFFAQEVVEIPQVSHTVSKGDGNPLLKPGDGEFHPWGLEHGRLEAMLVAELQDVRARLASLEATIATPATRKK